MRRVWFALGALFLGLAIIGIALPVMPTVPFLLVAAWAFARSSPRLRQKIMDHPTYGPPVRAWQERGAISRPAKIWALGAMTAGVVFTWWLGLPLWIVGGQAAVCTAVGIYVASRPEVRY
ncbi:YbaN family protein [Paracoccus stylophorae]|uniref:YbaN family protein n=1 Tax=Paracoccus stylophorae TaxID=659350 RepID=A0ABY7SVH7_9RHOB|nr:YbaN family protein [Paracoccus stylophorae]WCR10931.1 YbaN family protein [Paracoccus stylophorae]